MRTAVVLFTRDLRVHDNPALAAACAEAEFVVPLFVLDQHLLTDRAANRVHFLYDCLADLRASLRGRDGNLVIRRGEPVAETITVARTVGATEVLMAADVSRYAGERERHLRTACASEGIALRTFPSLTVVPPGALVPAGGDHFKVFTPYWRVWTARRWRDVEPAPDLVRLPPTLEAGPLPDLGRGYPGAELPVGGETVGRRRMHAWLRGSLAGYDEHRDELAAPGTSQLSAYLHFGCLSARELAEQAAEHGSSRRWAGGSVSGRSTGGGRGFSGVAGTGGDRAGSVAEPFIRQLCWRDFFHQVTAAFPDIAERDYRPHRQRLRDDPESAQAWRDGRTGYPVVDAAMRQLAAEGWLPNRARLIVAGFLTRTLGLDWRIGADHFSDLLVDGDVANNCGNWQWVAGTGNDTRPNRGFNPLRQAHRFDPDGEYVRRYVPELSDVDGSVVHEPWRLGGVPDYPPPLVAPEPARVAH